MQKSLILLCASALLGACASFTGTDLAGLQRPLIEPDRRDDAEQLIQSLRITWQGETHQLLGVIELSHGRTALAVFTPAGMKLFSVIQNSDGLSIEKNPALPVFVDPRSILADAQLVNWPLPALRSGLPKPWRIEEKDSMRRLWWHDEQVAEAVYEGPIAEWQSVELTGPRSDYQLVIRSLGKEVFD